MTVLVHRDGLDAYGRRPRQGLPVRYRCIFCELTVKGTQPAPGQCLALCRECVEKYGRDREASPL